VEKALGIVEVFLRVGPIVVKRDMVVMPSGCGYNMLLGNELMTMLRADIMQNLKVARFQVAGRLCDVSSYAAQRSARGQPRGSLL
jgi:hypothetical protein